MTYKHLLNVLIKCFTCPKFKRLYSGRWDTWLIQNGHMEEWKHLTLKTDDQLSKILEHAKVVAEDIENSPLTKALR